MSALFNKEKAHTNGSKVHCIREVCRSGNAQITEAGAWFKRAVTRLNVMCQCPMMATETLRGERMCANGRRIYGDNVWGMHRQRKEGDNDK